ncbi:hypothetical protein TorRG33x02_194170 [Trema orientale]|uniref:RNase H type-1 domain-containing protein n=1 Tax=Trema orientale TaxID=63057 RepID=A0A2P5EH48_TREOI|nr:hypothetical protein TorRG33x02_194170 [Trema orientale]
MQNTSIPNVWHPPPTGCLKLNIDAALGPRKNVIDIRGFLEIVLVLLTHDLPSSLAESNSLNAVNALRECCFDSVEGHILRDISALLSYLGDVSCSYVSRLGNNVAQNLAHWSFKFLVDRVWNDECPDVHIIFLVLY